MEIYAKINDTIEPTLLSKLTGFYYYGNMAQVTQVWKLTSTPPGPTAKTTVDETNAEKENLFRDKKKMNPVKWIDDCMEKYTLIATFNEHL